MLACTNDTRARAHTQFAYGQTGSGKTFTMGGNAEYPGITPRAVGEIFQIARENEATMSMKVGAVGQRVWVGWFADL